ncbi:MAG: PsbP-related protein [Halobacteriota archaeon]
MPEKEMPKSRLGTLLIICLFIVATVSAGYIGYWWGTRDDPLTSSPNWNTYTDKNLGFALAYPAAWRGEITKDGYLLFKGPVDVKGSSPNIIVQAMLPASSGGNYSSYEDAASNIVDQLKTNENYTLSSYTQTTICNESARELVCAYSYNGLALKERRIIFQDSNTGYIYMIVYTATETSYPEYIKTFEKAKGTFRFDRVSA